ncbi:MAG: LacI family DNA-binding transcriptional regulator [Clostridia bacterium]|nr:LacI family DNA-binding transcriptional regulator [Clostridia bacterium]
MKIYTIRDIAEMAGVSVTTVSRVLNNRPDVSAETVKKVQRVMQECHFVVNPNARGLKQADQEIIAVIIRGRNNPFLNALAEEIALCKRSDKAAMITEYIDEEADEFRHALGLLRGRRVAGLIFVGSRMDERCAVLDGISLPMVFATVSTVGTPMERASSVSMDDRKMACEAVTALLKRGHRKIAVFGGERTGQDSLALRARGAEDAFQAMGLSFEDERYIKTRLTLSDAYAAALDYFRRFPDATAAFCMGDTAALGVIRALKDLGLKVPEDVSVMGVDGTDIGRYTTPRLSTVAQPVREIARQSVKVLSDLMENGGPPKHVTVKASLEIRESVSEARQMSGRPA